ncbi:MAG: hypothetical protein OXB93_01325, partial [Cytophagales bacterium]|nr:hypothetical protein [Cytophagales bacterium]
MNTIRIGILGFVIFSLSLYAQDNPRTIIRVKAGSAASEPDGSSWEKAYANLAEALKNANNTTDIYLSVGIYKPVKEPDAEDPRTASFKPKGAKIHGGYYGDSDDNRYENPKSDEQRSILSGDIGREIPGDNAGSFDSSARNDNTYRVIHGNGNFDLITIQHAYGGAAADGAGTYKRCLFRWNESDITKHSVAAVQGDATLVDCRIEHNKGTSILWGRARIDRCRIQYNEYSYLVLNAIRRLTNSLIYKNKGIGGGPDDSTIGRTKGCIFLDLGEILNCTIYDNQSHGNAWATAVNNHQHIPVAITMGLNEGFRQRRVINNIILRSGAIYVNGSPPNESYTGGRIVKTSDRPTDVVRNCVLDGPILKNRLGSGLIQHKYSRFLAFYPQVSGVNIIRPNNVNELFFKSLTEDEPDFLSPSLQSPFLNYGVTNLIAIVYYKDPNRRSDSDITDYGPEGYATEKDLLGNPRVVGESIDIGAFEYPYNVSLKNKLHSSNSPVYGLRPAASGEIFWVLHHVGSPFPSVDQVKSPPNEGAFKPLNAGKFVGTQGEEVEIKFTGLSPGRLYTLYTVTENGSVDAHRIISYGKPTLQIFKEGQLDGVALGVRCGTNIAGYVYYAFLPVDEPAPTSFEEIRNHSNAFKKGSFLFEPPDVQEEYPYRGLPDRTPDRVYRRKQTITGIPGGIEYISYWILHVQQGENSAIRVLEGKTLPEPEILSLNTKWVSHDQVVFSVS